MAGVGGRDVGSKALVAARLRHEKGFSRHHQQHYQQFIGSISGTSSGGGSPSTSNSNAPETIEKSEEPRILTPKSTHVSTRVGQAATFNCVVKHLGNRQVGGPVTTLTQLDIMPANSLVSIIYKLIYTPNILSTNNNQEEMNYVQLS